MPRKAATKAIDQAVLEPESIAAPEVMEETTPPPAPTQSDPEWQSYVLSKLNPGTDFDDKGNPLADSLRPLVLELCGPIVSSRPVQVFEPNRDNRFTATVVYEIEVDFSGGERTDIRRFGDAADINNTNSGKYAQFSVATATTRAKGRCYKEALGLRKVYVAEEFSDTPAEESVMTGFITLPQRKLIDKLCREMDINGLEFINVGSRVRYNSLKEVGYDKAHELIEKLNQFQQAADRIPAGLIGYDPAWPSGSKNEAR